MTPRIASGGPISTFDHHALDRDENDVVTFSFRKIFTLLKPNEKLER